MIRQEFIERNFRQITGGFPTDDSELTYNLINSWLNDAIGVAAKANYMDAIKLDGVGYVNNSFYTKFKNLSVSQDERFTYKITLPQIPFGIGQNEGVNTLQFTDSNGNVSLNCIPLSEKQVTYFQTMRAIPNKTLYYSEGTFIYVKSTLLLNQYTASVGMISGGNGNDLTSTLNVPADYFPVMVEYLKSQLAFERAQIKDNSNDGNDIK